MSNPRSDTSENTVEDDKSTVRAFLQAHEEVASKDLLSPSPESRLSYSVVAEKLSPDFSLSPRSLNTHLLRSLSVLDSCCIDFCLDVFSVGQPNFATPSPHCSSPSTSQNLSQSAVLLIAASRLPLLPLSSLPVSLSTTPVLSPLASCLLCHFLDILFCSLSTLSYSQPHLLGSTPILLATHFSPV